MDDLREKLVKMSIPSRKNVSVPNPADSDTGIVEQVPLVFIKDYSYV